MWHHAEDISGGGGDQKENNVPWKITRKGGECSEIGFKEKRNHILDTYMRAGVFLCGRGPRTDQEKKYDRGRRIKNAGNCRMNSR